jgi:negative regulator of sigma E activity
VPGSKSDSVSYSIADGKGLSRHTYRLVGRERIKTPVGEFDTIKAARQGDDRETAEVWLAQQYSYIPVRLLVVDRDGTRMEQLPTRISQ